MDALIFETLRRVAAEQDKAKKALLRDETAKMLGEHFGRHTADLEELAFDLLNLSWSDALTQDIVPSVIEVKSVGLGDTDYIEDDLRGMRAYWQGKGGQILSDILRYERTYMPREEMVTAIDYHNDDLVLNFWGSFDKLRAQSQEKLRTLPMVRLIELVQAAITSGTTFGSFAAATLTDDQVDTVVDEVAAKSDGDVTIIGTRIATRQLAKVGLDFGDNLKEQIFRTGQIGVYKGYPVVQVTNSEDFLGNFLLPNDELWVVGRKAGRLTFYGSSAKVQQLKLPSFFGRWETARDAGMLLYGASKGRIGRIVLT